MPLAKSIIIIIPEIYNLFHNIPLRIDSVFGLIYTQIAENKIHGGT